MSTKMKIKRILSILSAIVILFTAVSEFPVTDKDIPGLTKTASAASWPSGPNKKSLSSNSAIVMELSTGTILYEKNIHKQHYPASITKIMTGMLALQNSQLTDTVTFSKEAVYGIESGSSTIYSEVGEKMTMEQCMYAIMLESANEVCLAVGEHVAGSVDAFVDMMNQKVQALGLTDTHFNNPNGLPDKKHYTTAYDMAVIAREAMKDADFRRFIGTKSYVCEKTNKHKMTRPWNNHHQMVNGYRYPKYEYKYCIGGKTGYTIVSRSTLVTYAEKDGMQLVCVIMKASNPEYGEPNEYTDSTKLLNFGFEKYQKHVMNADSAMLSTDLFNNYGSYFNPENSPVHLSADANIILPKGVDVSTVKQTVSYDNSVQIQEGDNTIGKVTYTYGNRTVGYSDIIYTKEADEERLDEASRDMLGDQISDIEDSNAKQKEKKKILSKFTKPFRKLASKIGKLINNQILASILLIAAGIILIVILAALLRSLTPSGRRRRRRNRAGGYRSRGGKRNHAKRAKQQRKAFSTKSVRRNHSSHYQKGNSQAKKPRRAKSGLQYHKRHKNTKESFGKNFFDF